MQIENISKHDFRKVKLYIPDNGINNMECKLYLLNNKNKWDNEYILFKKFNNTKGKFFSNKLYIINSLIEQKDKINIEELVMPIGPMSVGGEICGYTMPYITNICISIILQSNIDIKDKINYLTEIGLLLEKIVKKDTFYPSDVHEGNFIYNKITKRINEVDMDSSYIGNYNPSISKYLINNYNLYGLHKYPMNDANINIPNKNTVYLSYIYMILNFISGVNYINKLNIADYYKYLQRLVDLELPKELVDIFAKIYSECDNINPAELLEAIPNNIKKFNYRGISI